MNNNTVTALLRAVFMLLAALALPAAAAAAEPAEKPATTTAESGAEPAAPPAIAVSEAAGQAEVTAATLRDIEAELARDAALVTFANELPALTREIDARAKENAKILAQKPSLEILRGLERGWQRLHARLGAAADDLAGRVAGFDRTMSTLHNLEVTWSKTLAAARTEAPRELVQRIQDLVADIKRVHGAVEARRSDALRLQNRIAMQDTRATQALVAIKARRDETINRVFEKDSLPIWSAALFERAGASMGRDMAQSLAAQLDTLQAYAERESDRLTAQLVAIMLLAAMFWGLRRKVDTHAEQDPGMRRAVSVFTMPIATAFVLVAFTSRWAFPQAPRLLWAIVGVAALVPTILILRRLIHRELLPVLYAVVIFYVVDQARAVVASLEAVPRLIFVAEMVCGALFVLWFQKSLPPASRTESRGRLTRLTAWSAFAFCAATGIANALGYVTLSNLLGNAVLTSAYYGVFLYALVVILDALIAVALAVRPLSLLGMVRRHGHVLRRRIGLVLRWGAFVLWTLALLDRLAIRERVVETGKAILNAEATLGSVSISLADVAAFAITVWASYLVSRFVQFMLEEDVYPRAHLRRGLPYAISRTLHYTILVAGFLLAVAALGFDMTKFTILAGAFTVGVGFGLQNIFNNFVSGLILLFERPVQVGDVIQMDDASGVVSRIGIRASVVRTSSGSEIIVPNGKLISERLENWTFSTRNRGVEIPVAVAHGADPRRVIELMNAAAAAHPQVSKQPPPQTLLTRMGPDWLGFELRAWTERVEDWMEVKSELSLTISDSLAAANIKLK